MRPIRVAIIGAGPAGIYAADILANEHPEARIDIIDRLPAPYGLVRYGVAPDHPRIKEIIKALRRVLSRDEIRFIGNVNYGSDVKLTDLKRHYDAVIFATGAHRDRALDIPGIDLDGSYGAADFVSWYDGHPDVPRDWPLTAKQVAVLGAGNVALDVARMLAKPADEQLGTEIPDNVYQGLKANQATDVHVFARRGPAQIKFSPMEFRELSHSPSVDVIVHPEGFEIDEGSQEAINQTKSVKLVVNTMMKYLDQESTGAAHRIHIHLCQSPVEILGEDGKVVGLRTEVTELIGDGTVRGTGEFKEWPVQSVYRAVGYLSSPLADVPFDHHDGVIPNEAGRVQDMDGQLEGVYVTGWIKRGPVGLIGHTKSDAAETIKNLLEDLPSINAPEITDANAILEHLSGNGVDFTTRDEWDKLDAHEVALGEAAGRLRIKVVDRDEMVSAGRR